MSDNDRRIETNEQPERYAYFSREDCQWHGVESDTPTVFDAPPEPTDLTATDIAEERRQASLSWSRTLVTISAGAVAFILFNLILTALGVFGG